MILFISISVFVATLLGCVAFYWWQESRRESLPGRLKDTANERVRAQSSYGADGQRSWLGWLRRQFRRRAGGEAELLEMLSGKELTGERLLLNQAGMRGRGVYRIYIAVRWALPVALVTLAVLFGRRVALTDRSIFLLALSGGICGLLIPDAVVRWKIRKRKEEITDSLPDALDLLVVCVEAGLALNAAFVKITEEFELTCPALSEEFDVVNREMVAGKPRQEALRALSDRTGVEDVKSLVAMLVQTEKLGTSLAQSLRVHSDSLRTRRRQRAEEAAAKTTIKLVFPLVFLMFPALFIVILGPGVLQIMKSILFTGAG
jgi:tight adherence protein C